MPLVLPVLLLLCLIALTIKVGVMTCGVAVSLTIERETDWIGVCASVGKLVAGTVVTVWLALLVLVASWVLAISA